MESPLEESMFDWTSALPPPHAYSASLAGAGAVCETKRFDSFYTDDGDYLTLPAGEKYKTRDAEAYESALTVTTYWDKYQSIEKTELEIKSPHMKAALKATVPEYESFKIEVRHITIMNHPWCLFHYRQELLNYGAALHHQNGDPAAPQHILHLISYMWDVFREELFSYSIYELTMDTEPTLEFEYLWMVFRPGDIVYVQEPHEKAMQFMFMKKLEDHWLIRGKSIDYDGNSFGFASGGAVIHPYEGVKPLRNLQVVKLDHLAADMRKKIEEKLVKRGERFVKIHGQQYLWYDGSHKFGGRTLKSRIMADYIGYISSGHGVEVEFLSQERTFNAINALQEMTNADLMVCNVFVAGYSLRENEWCTFHIDFISDIKLDSQAFNSLILPRGEKQQLLSLVRRHEDENMAFDDLITGKGRGMVFLLYGETGVGKTLTAESIAEYCQKPLVRLDAGRLGTSPTSVERGLKDAFKLAERWQGVLLLDEADVYLEQRRSKNLQHNGIVSVFLRMLEYYRGILFLTTNRISSFDKAFVSRIHLAIRYPPLSKLSRRRLLKTFLNQASEESATALSQQGVLDTLAEESLNGREIKNLVRTASAMALSDGLSGCRINKNHLEAALQPVKQFSLAMKEDLVEEGNNGEEGEITVESGGDEDSEVFYSEESGERFDDEESEVSNDEDRQRKRRRFY